MEMRHTGFVKAAAEFIDRGLTVQRQIDDGLSCTVGKFSLRLQDYCRQRADAKSANTRWRATPGLSELTLQSVIWCLIQAVFSESR